MSKKLYPPMNEDIPFIKCDVCQKGVKYLFRKTKSMREDTGKVVFLKSRIFYSNYINASFESIIFAIYEEEAIAMHVKQFSFI